MDILDLSQRLAARLPPGLLRALYRGAKRLPPVRAALERQYRELLSGLDAELHPYRQELPARSRLPASGVPRTRLLATLRKLQLRERSRWADGFASGAVYHGAQEHVDFVNQVYALHSQANPLHADLWPSAVKFEAEVVAMTAHMLGAAAAAEAGDEICGTVTSGGTESILLAMKAYRDRARAERGLRHAEIVAPVTAHAAFDKAADYFRMRLRKVPIGADGAVSVAAVRAALSRRTVVLVGSAPSFPHGVIDPLPELAELAASRGIGFHCDACLGGFVLPWAERLGYPVPAFDFRLRGVTSMSADTHKYGYAAKGTSVVLYRGRELLHHQYFKATDWPGGLYFSPTLAGSRPGGLSAAAWAALMAMGESGYLRATKAILQTAARLRRGIEAIPELRLIGDGLFVLAIASDQLDIYRVLEQLGKRGWSLNGLHRPACVHLCVTLRHTQPGVAQRFLRDLRAAVKEVAAAPQERGQMAPIYGLAATLPVRGLVGDLLERYLDALYSP